MYYHSIDFKTQGTFLLFSMIAGCFAGIVFILLFSRNRKKLKAVFSDILACVAPLFILVCTNIVLEDAALRVYEVITFICSLILTVLFLKPMKDKVLDKIRFLNTKTADKPVFRKSKQLVNSFRIVLKNDTRIVYNFFKRKVGDTINHERKRCKKEKEKKQKV